MHISFLMDSGKMKEAADTYLNACAIVKNREAFDKGYQMLKEQ